MCTRSGLGLATSARRAMAAACDSYRSVRPHESAHSRRLLQVPSPQRPSPNPPLIQVPLTHEEGGDVLLLALPRELHADQAVLVVRRIAAVLGAHVAQVVHVAAALLDVELRAGKVGLSRSGSGRPCLGSRSAGWHDPQGYSAGVHCSLARPRHLRLQVRPRQAQYFTPAMRDTPLLLPTPTPTPPLQPLPSATAPGSSCGIR